MTLAIDCIECIVVPPEGTNSTLYRVQVLDRAVAIVNALANVREDASLAELSELVHFHKSTVHRLVMVLERHRIIDRDPKTGRYRLGLKLFELGSAAVARFNVRDRARRHLEHLMYHTDETVHLCVLDQGEVLYLDKMEPTRSVRLSSSIGRRNPVHCTAVGKAILACLPEQEVDDIIRRHGLPRFTTRTITTPAEFKAELRSVREKGYAVDDEEHEDGVRCVAVVVLDHENHPAAAISVSAPSFRITMEKVPMLAEAVKEAAQTLSLEWGHQPASIREIPQRAVAGN